MPRAALPGDFDVVALHAALDQARASRGMSWAGVARDMWELSPELNARRNDHPISASALTGMAARGATSCQHALFMLRWLGRPPEDFAGGAHESRAPMPAAGPDRRLRWNLKRLHAALDAERRERALTWEETARLLGCHAGQLTGLARARFGTSMILAMRITAWLGRPAADFVDAARW